MKLKVIGYKVLGWLTIAMSAPVFGSALSHGRPEIVYAAASGVIFGIIAIAYGAQLTRLQR
jgi:hypothetical protein